MRALRYVLVVNVPDELDADAINEVEADADPRDGTQLEQIDRFLGGPISDATALLSSWLPDGWSAKTGGRL
jgi:hypothetical protein